MRRGVLEDLLIQKVLWYQLSIAQILTLNSNVLPRGKMVIIVILAVVLLDTMLKARGKLVTTMLMGMNIILPMLDVSVAILAIPAPVGKGDRLHGLSQAALQGSISAGILPARWTGPVLSVHQPIRALLVITGQQPVLGLLQEPAPNARAAVTALGAQASLQHGLRPLVQQAPTSVQHPQPQSMGLAQDAQAAVTAWGAQANLQHGLRPLV
jgi:hypothetical protein